MHFAYAQDDFKVNSRLTLNLGARYEFATPQWEDKNLLANFDPATATLIKPKTALIRRALVNRDYNNWAPRIGFAYNALDRTVVRGGYGISYIDFNGWGAKTCWHSTGPTSSATESLSNLAEPLCRRQFHRLLPQDGAGLPGRLRLAGAIQPAHRPRQLHAARHAHCLCAELAP